MNISIKGTNVIVLYGDGAAARYSDLIHRWSGMISSNQWQTFQFILVASKKPELDLSGNELKLVGDNNTIFYRIDDTAPDPSGYYNLVFDKIQQGDVQLHLIVDAGGAPISYNWLKAFAQAAMNVESLTTRCLYYLLFGRNNSPEERDEIISVLKDTPGAVFFLSDTHENGGRVLPEERWHAVELAVLMNSAGNLPISTNKVYSFGYSALNANGSELKMLRESAACRALSDEIGRPIQSLAESDFYIRLLPEGVASVEGLKDWVANTIRQYVRNPKPNELGNAWIMIRMNPELAPGEAVERMKRFADLNYAANDAIRADAKELAQRQENILRDRLCRHPVTACLSENVLLGIANQFHEMVQEDPRPQTCVYPPKSLRVRMGRGVDEYAQDCRSAVRKSIEKYIWDMNTSVFASEMEKVYRRIAEWVSSIQNEPVNGSHYVMAGEVLQAMQRDLDRSDAGNAQRLGIKYKRYKEALDQLHPGLQTLTEGIEGAYYQPSGAIEEKGWRDLISKAGSNLERKLPNDFRGDFFRVLGREFDTLDEREKFFDEYLRNGLRMYRNLTAQVSSGVSVLLADNRLMQQWSGKSEIYEVNTDNAENLTLYPLGEKNAAEYLADGTVYFKGQGSGSTSSGESLFRGSSRPAEPRPEPAKISQANSMFGVNTPVSVPEEADEDAEDRRAAVRLEPDESNEYKLSWPWNKNDQTAMVEFVQFGERVGRVAVIPVQNFHSNGNCMNVTKSVMEGKPLPRGILTVTIRDTHGEIYIGDVKVHGRRDVVRYKATNTRLEIKPENRRIVEHLTLRTIEPDGTRIYYPMYPGDGDHPWLFDNLKINNVKIVTDGTMEGEDIYPVRVEK